MKRDITWLIDLDNTLHNASHAIFPAIHVNMNNYMAHLLGDGVTPADAATVDAARQFYWDKYGATLMGLIKHHNVNANDFLHQTHHIDNLADLLRYESGLRRLMHQLPGRKILFTNAPRQYSRKVVSNLGLHRHFDHHISIESMRVHGQLRPKPSKSLLKKVIAKYKLRGRQCALIEDTLVNLKSAKQLGMKTVWITQYLNHPKQKQRFARSHFVDLKVRSVKLIPKNIPKLFN